ncbi:MerR family transcriptional regulator [Kitasatospora albolonga]|uniref:MerR family transcriptional regulator n=1 Tax=Kitasatospora albolonga TaxID=68173 RepID=UPI0031F18791
MRIGELAALVGVSTRTVRHYHHQGLLPEPERRANGYREYGLRDAVELARVRRLAELGLSLDEIRDVLADDRGRELREVLAELDRDLARQQQAIADRRARLAALLAQEELHPDSAVDPELADVLAALPVEGSPFAALDRDVFALVHTAGGPEQRAELLDMIRPLAGNADLLPLYRRLDALAGAAPDDPEVGRLAEELVAHLPPVMAELMAGRTPGEELPTALAEELAPAQLAVIRRLFALLGGEG